MIGEKVKLVHSDNGESKVIKGVLKEKDSLTYIIETPNGNVIEIGRMFTIKVNKLDQGE